MVYVFPLLVCPYAKILAVEQKEEKLFEKLFFPHQVVTKETKHQDSKLPNPLLTINPTNDRKCNLLGSFLIYLLCQAVTPKYSICFQHKKEEKRDSHISLVYETLLNKAASKSQAYNRNNFYHESV